MKSFLFSENRKYKGIFVITGLFLFPNKIHNRYFHDEPLIFNTEIIYEPSLKESFNITQMCTNGALTLHLGATMDIINIHGINTYNTE